jgi:2-haloacid dehalogenase
MSIKAVVFDIGNVLIRWQPELYYDATIGPDRRRKMFADVDLHGLQDQLDAGADFKTLFYTAADANPKWRDEIRTWHDRWNDLAQPEIPHSVALLRALRAKSIPVFALTNFGSGSFSRSEQQYPFLKEFDKRYISGDMNAIKPDPKIYEMMEADCGVLPNQLLFTDDRIDNITTAQARGWQTHLFKNPQRWADRLVAENLLTPEEAAFNG